MVEHIKQQLAAQGINATPKRTSGRGAADKPAAGRKAGQKDHSAEFTNEQIQAARAEVVNAGRLAWENPIFGLPAFYRKCRLLDAAQARQLDEAFYAISGTQPQ